MTPINMGATRILNAPPGWDEAADGPCIGLPVVDAHGHIYSFWRVAWRERLRILFGRPVQLCIASACIGSEYWESIVAAKDAEIEQLRNALAELVRLKDLAEQIDRLAPYELIGSLTPSDFAHLQAARAGYTKERKAAAWAAARAIFADPLSAQSPHILSR
jgi:hypothetical protein